MSNYEKVEKAIIYMTEHFREQPRLFEVSEVSGLSPFHFQKIFKEWAGVSPKRFLQFISIGHAKKLLTGRPSLSEVAHETGLSGTSRLYDLFIAIEGMTPGEYKNGGKGLHITWEKYGSPFGEVLIACTHRGICYMAFTEQDGSGFDEMNHKFPSALYSREKHPFHNDGLSGFRMKPANPEKIKLHLKGTPFQLKVWEALLKVPLASLATYSDIAEYIGSPGASRAVGSAVGANPVAFLIPCHRVIRNSGIIGEYHWGSTRKKAIIGLESSMIYGEN